MHRRLLSLALLGLAVPSVASAKPRIVGGSETTAAAVPYQVALLDARKSGTTFQKQFCGGTILDATHVVTAAHCVTEPSGSVTLASDLQVLAGVTRLSEGDATPLVAPAQRVAVAGITRNAGYDDATTDKDSALLTLGAPLVYGARVQQVALASTVMTGGTLLVSGWGCTASYVDDDDPSTGTPCDSGSNYPDALRSTTLDFVTDATCDNTYGADLDKPNELCAEHSGKDTCQGDSGGPAVQVGALADLSTYRLAGITSFGDGCAAGVPGVYAEVASAAIQAPLARDAVTTKPAVTTAPSVATASGVVTCDPGAWTGSPTFTYRFEATDGTILRARSGVPTFTPISGQTVACTVFGDTPVATTSLRSDQVVAAATTVDKAPTGSTGPSGSTGTTGTPPATTTTTPPPVTPPPPTPTTTIPSTLPPTVKDLQPPKAAFTQAKRLRVSKTGVFSVVLASSGEPAAGRVTFTLTKKVKRKVVMLGRRDVVCPGTEALKVALKLAAADRRKLVKAGRLAVTAYLDIVDASGNDAHAKVALTLLAPR